MPQDAVVGNWTRSDFGLISPAETPVARIALSVPAPLEYVLEMDVQRLQGDGELCAAVLAGGWYDMGKQQQAPFERGALQRAQMWYRQAESKLDGTARLAATRRLEELQTRLAELDQSASATGASRALPALEPGLVAEYYHGEFARKIGTVIDPVISTERLKAADSGVPPDEVSIRWTGYLVTRIPGEYRLRLSADDGARLWLDDKLVLDVTLGSRETTVQFDRRPRRLKLEYVAHTATNEVRLEWQLPNEPWYQVPPPALNHTPREVESARRNR